jgi:hypothetical protein
MEVVEEYSLPHKEGHNTESLMKSLTESIFILSRENTTAHPNTMQMAERKPASSALLSSSTCKIPVFILYDYREDTWTCCLVLVLNMMLPGNQKLPPPDLVLDH